MPRRSGGQVPDGLPAGGTTVVTLFWQPEAVSGGLSTVARVDPSDVIVESDESNNDFQAVVQVVEPTVRTVTLRSQAGLDGYVIRGQGTYAGAEIRTGNIGSELGERVYRGFLSFDLAGIPDEAVVTQAELRIFQPEVVGDPYGKLGQLVLKHVDYGSSLDADDFDAAELGSLPVSGPIPPGEWYASSDLVPWIAQDLAASRTRTQIRLQFSSETDGDTEADYARFESGDDALGSGNLPDLTITYVY